MRRRRHTPGTPGPAPGAAPGSGSPGGSNTESAALALRSITLAAAPACRQSWPELICTGRLCQQSRGIADPPVRPSVPGRRTMLWKERSASRRLAEHSAWFKRSGQRSTQARASPRIGWTRCQCSARSNGRGSSTCGRPADRTSRRSASSRCRSRRRSAATVRRRGAAAADRRVVEVVAAVLVDPPGDFSLNSGNHRRRCVVAPAPPPPGPPSWAGVVSRNNRLIAAGADEQQALDKMKAFTRTTLKAIPLLVVARNVGLAGSHDPCALRSGPTNVRCGGTVDAGRWARWCAVEVVGRTRPLLPFWCQTRRPSGGSPGGRRCRTPRVPKWSEQRAASHRRQDHHVLDAWLYAVPACTPGRRDHLVAAAGGG